MARVLIVLLLVVAILCAATIGYYWILPPIAKAQINTFCASNLACTVTAIWTFTGATSFKNLATRRYISPSNAQGWTGTDWAAQVGSAIADCPSGPAGCEIVFETGTYNGGATPIVVTGNKPILFNCENQPVLNWTTTNNTAFTIDLSNGANTQMAYSGLLGCYLNGPGSGTTAIGLALGSSSSSGAPAGVIVDHNRFTNWNMAMKWPNTGTGQGPFLAQITNNAFGNAGAGNSIGVDLAEQASENALFWNNCFCNNATGLKFESTFKAASLHFASNSFDSNTVRAIDGSLLSTGMIMTGQSNHFEDNASGVNTDMIVWAGAGYRGTGDTFTIDATTSSGGEVVSVTGGEWNCDRCTWGTAGKTYTQAVNVSSATANSHLVNPVVDAHFSTPVVSASGQFKLEQVGTSETSSTSAYQAVVGGLTVFKIDQSGNETLNGNIRHPFGQIMGLTPKTGSGAGNYTGTNTTYAAVDTTNLCAVITIPTGWKLDIEASGVLESVTAAVAQNVALVDAGATCTSGGVTALSGTERNITPPAAGVFDENFYTHYVLTGDGNPHSVALVAKTSAAADAWGIQNTSATVAPSMRYLLMPSN